MEIQKNRVIKWFIEDKFRILMLVVLVFAFALRIHYFFLTSGQPLWWDEAEYMLKAKSIAFGTPDSGWWSGRPVLFPLISAVFFKLGLGLMSIKFLFALMSTLNIFLLYWIGRRIFNEKVGVIAAFLMSVFYLDLFYSSRMLVDMPQIFFVLLGCACFIEGYFAEGSKKFIWAVLPVLFIGILLRFTVGLFVIILLIYLLAVEGLKLFNKKEWYVSAFIAFILFLPYMIYSWVKFKNPIYVLTSVMVGSATVRSVSPWQVFMQYISYFPNYSHYFVFIAMVIGCIMIISLLVLSLDVLRKEKRAKFYLLLFLWFIMPLIYFGFFVNHFEDRYIFMLFPAGFLIAAFAFDKIHELGIKKIGMLIASIIIIGLLLFSGWKMYAQSDSIIKQKIDSYNGLKESGLWIKENSIANDKVVSAGVPQNTFYSERETYPFPANESEFIGFVKENNVSFMIVSIWEKSPDWSYIWAQNNNDKVSPVFVHYLDKEKKKASSVVYAFNKIL